MLSGRDLDDKCNDMFDVESRVPIHHKLREHILILSDKASTSIRQQDLALALVLATSPQKLCWVGEGS